MITPALLVMRSPKVSKPGIAIRPPNACILIKRLTTLMVRLTHNLVGIGGVMSRVAPIMIMANTSMTGLTRWICQ
jgi:hypothetical protein